MSTARDFKIELDKLSKLKKTTPEAEDSLDESTGTVGVITHIY